MISHNVLNDTLGKSILKDIGNGRLFFCSTFTFFPPGFSVLLLFTIMKKVIKLDRRTVSFRGLPDAYLSLNC